MKQAFMTVLLYTIAVNLIGALVATVFSLVYLLFAIIDFLLSSLGTMIFIIGLIKALSLFGLTILLFKGLGLLTVAGGSLLMKAFSGAKNLATGLAGGLSQIDPSGTKESFKKVANNVRDLDGRKVANMGRSLGRMGFRRAGRGVRRAGNALSSADELQKISRKDNDGKDLSSLTKKDGKRGIFPESLLKDDKKDLKDNKEKDSSEKVSSDKEKDIQRQGGTINILNQAADPGQTGFNEADQDGAIIPYVIAENLMLANGLNSDDVVESVKAYNGNVRDHLDNADKELGHRDALASDASEELRSQNPEFFNAARELPGGESLNSAMNVSRTDEENSQFINHSTTGDDNDALIDDDKQARFISGANGTIDKAVAEEYAQQSSDRLNAVAAGMAGMAAGSTDQSAINAAEELETANNSEHYTDTLHRNPIHGKVASKELTETNGVVDDEDVLLDDPEAALRYKNNMKSGEIIDLKENENGTFTAEEYEAASTLEPLTQSNTVMPVQEENVVSTGQSDNVAQPENATQQTGTGSVQNITQVNNYGNSEQGNNSDNVTNSDLLNAMEDGIQDMNNKPDMSTLTAAMASSVAASSFFKDEDKNMEFSDDTINRLEDMITKTNDQDRIKDRREAQKLISDNSDSSHNPLTSSSQETTNISNINTNINNTVKSAASDIKNSNPDISDNELNNIREDLRKTLNQAVNLNNRRKIQEEAERELNNGMERMKNSKNDGKA